MRLARAVIVAILSTAAVGSGTVVDGRARGGIGVERIASVACAVRLSRTIVHAVLTATSVVGGTVVDGNGAVLIVPINRLVARFALACVVAIFSESSRADCVGTTIIAALARLTTGTFRITASTAGD